MQAMKTNRFINTFGLPALIGLILMAPFAFLELWYNTAKTFSFSRFPFPLFVVLWLLPTVFVVTVAPIVRGIRAGNNVLVHPISLLWRIVLPAFIALMWTGLVYDQLPCFLGVPNCD